jgi:hypothetical protein
MIDILLLSILVLSQSHTLFYREIPSYISILLAKYILLESLWTWIFNSSEDSSEVIIQHKNKII